jgi:hypothetical protein
MNHNWDLRISLPALQRRSVQQADGGGCHATQRAQAIRARANSLYMRGEMARAAQLLMELEGQSSHA